MGVRRAGGTKRPFAPGLEIEINPALVLTLENLDGVSFVPVSSLSNLIIKLVQFF